MITVDSGVWIAFFRGQETRQTRLLDAVLDDSTHGLVLLDLVLMEILRGFRHDHEWRAANALLAPLPVASAGGEAVAMRAAGIYRDLRSRGTTVRSSVDLMVGAWCVDNDCALLHDDRDFHHMEGLQTWTL